MSVYVGVHPGGRSSFAVCALFWQGRLPAWLFTYRVYSSVQEVLNDIVGVFGEWGDITGVAVDAPLTWAGSIGGKRDNDKQLRALLPDWVPATWVRAPNSQVGAATMVYPFLLLLSGSFKSDTDVRSRSSSRTSARCATIPSDSCQPSSIAKGNHCWW